MITLLHSSYLLGSLPHFPGYFSNQIEIPCESNFSLPPHPPFSIWPGGWELMFCNCLMMVSAAPSKKRLQRGPTHTHRHIHRHTHALLFWHTHLPLGSNSQLTWVPTIISQTNWRFWNIKKKSAVKIIDAVSVILSNIFVSFYFSHQGHMNPGGQEPVIAQKIGNGYSPQQSKMGIKWH